ncbi:MAG: histidine--tRNA ligase [Holosporaceae bacterium]|jgi:histidyl-tRNA synthetase|nr:histidine--tRNA ligase [Holosporaceae bacterium]
MKSDISGFPEFLPCEQIAFDGVVDAIRKQFELYGFVPMETAAVERISTLVSKGSDHEIYGIYRMADENLKKELGLRFDLTVPLARYVISNANELIFPHKRYQIAPVWRGERPQFGRYRQFHQCDIDIIGHQVLSIANDAEIIAIITEILQLMNVPKFYTRISNRKILCGFLKTIVEEAKVPEVIRLIDKSDKISETEFDDSLIGLCPDKKNDVSKIKNFIYGEKKKRDNAELLKWLKGMRLSQEYEQGVAELDEVVQLLKRVDMGDDFVKVSTSLARGFDYYTGCVFETVFCNANDIGSIAGGGRYDNLASMMSANACFPGVGATIGISRLIPKLFEQQIVACDRNTTAQLLVTTQNRKYISSYIKIAQRFRRAGIKTESYLNDKALGVQLKYASKKGFRFVLIANETELLEGKAILRDLHTKQQMMIRTEYISSEVADIFGHSK